MIYKLRLLKMMIRNLSREEMNKYLSIEFLSDLSQMPESSSSPITNALFQISLSTKDKGMFKCLIGEVDSLLIVFLQEDSYVKKILLLADSRGEPTDLLIGLK
jgi:hypothetical protein